MGSMSPTADPTVAPTADPTMFPTEDPTPSPVTPYPTTAEVIEESATMVFEGDFNELESYAESQGQTKEEVAEGIVRDLLGLDDSADVTIIITDVRSGSVIIDYTLQSQSADALADGIANIEESVGETIVVGDGFELAMESNTVVVSDDAMSTTDEGTTEDSDEPGGNSASAMSVV